MSTLIVTNKTTIQEVMAHSTNGECADEGLRSYRNSSGQLVLYKKPLASVPLWVFQKLGMAQKAGARANIMRGQDAYGQAMAHVRSASRKQSQGPDGSGISSTSVVKGPGATAGSGTRAQGLLTKQQMKDCLQAAVDELYCQKKGLGVQVLGGEIDGRTFGNPRHVFVDSDDQVATPESTGINRVTLSRKGFLAGILPGQELVLDIDAKGATHMVGTDKGYTHWFLARAAGKEIRSELAKPAVRQSLTGEMFKADWGSSSPAERILDHLLGQPHFQKLLRDKSISLNEKKETILKRVEAQLARLAQAGKNPDVYEVVAEVFTEYVSELRRVKFMEDLKENYNWQVQQLREAKQISPTHIPPSPRSYKIPVTETKTLAPTKLTVAVNGPDRYCQRMQAVFNLLKGEDSFEKVTRREGLFRVPGNISSYTPITQDWADNKDVSAERLGALFPDDHAALIKDLIQKFPGGLLGTEMVKLKGILYSESDQGKQREAIEQHLEKLPSENKKFLNLLMELCLVLEANSESTRMSAPALAYVILGSVFDNQESNRPLDELSDEPKRTNAGLALFNYFYEKERGKQAAQAALVDKSQEIG